MVWETRRPYCCVLSSGSFELRIKSFTNSLGRLSSGQCCDGSSNSDAPCLAPCRTKFRVCLKIYQANIDTTSPCTFGDITTPVLGGNSLDVPNLNVEGFSNPIVFPFDFTWPLNLQYNGILIFADNYGEVVRARDSIL
ncbi:Neurogenic locus protein delta [Papilio xuthus]|uniref:Neurogenic locus protein delta n=1 Tax=Papilio xuthus TaxID=66420 RepID=A0A194Q1A7_PAPXU|nr:Neurogenic locus protein delta [Papilio xuthus]